MLRSTRKPAKGGHTRSAARSVPLGRFWWRRHTPPRASATPLRNSSAGGWVRENLPALEGDPVARQGAVAHIAAVRGRFERTAGRALGLFGHVLDPSALAWFFEGRKCTPHTMRPPRRSRAALQRQGGSASQQPARSRAAAGRGRHAGSRKTSRVCHFTNSGPGSAPLLCGGRSGRSWKSRNHSTASL